MEKAILRKCLFVAVLAVLLSGLISAATISYVQKGEVTQQLLANANILLSEQENWPQGEALDAYLKERTAFVSEQRVTVIAPDGEVLADTQEDIHKMENHNSRPEVIGARESFVSVIQRKSDTITENMLYVAKLGKDGTVVRVSQSIGSIPGAMRHIFPAILLGIVVASVFAGIMAKAVSRRMMQPVNELCHALELGAAGKTAQELNALQKEFLTYQEFDAVWYEIKKLLRQIAQNMDALAYEKEKSQFIFDHIDQGIILLDLQENILHLNDKIKSLFHVEEDVIGKSFRYILREQELDEKIQVSLHHGEESEFPLRLWDYPENEFLCHVHPVIFSDHSMQGVIITIRDVTALKQAEKVRSDFFANASHELKTPLTSIKGFTEILSSGMVQDKQVMLDYLQRITKEADRMMELINDILLISKLEVKGQTEIEKEWIDLFSVAQEVCAGLQPQAAAKKVQLILHPADISFYMNAHDLKHIFTNLIDNAIKYNKENGKVEISITQETVEERAAVVITVADTGIGIPLEDQSRVFERFYRVDKGRSRKMGSTGLGLAIVKHTVALYQGKIQLESVEKQGTTVKIILFL